MYLPSFILRYKLHHLLFWFLVGAVWYYLRFNDYSSRFSALIVTAVKVVDIALLIYIVNYFLIPRFLYKNRYILFTVLVLLLVAISSYLKLQVLGRSVNFQSIYQLTPKTFKTRIYDNMLPHLFLVIAGIFFKVIVDYMDMQQKMNMIAKEKAETELDFLRSQINPHFLFNSLNSVYFLIDKKNESARDALHRFSEMLRYQLYESNRDNVSLERERKYLEDYVDLQRLRKSNSLNLIFYFDPTLSGHSIAPLLLIPFVENAFKHVSNRNDGSDFIHIDIRKEKKQLRMEVKNSKEMFASTDPHSGIGLVNVKRRLELLYPKHHQLIVKETQDDYSVIMLLDLDLSQQVFTA